MDPRLTVVIPIYNVEEYLPECLASVAAQTLRELDVVMVDDGSTDSGPQLAREFAARDPRFRLVTQENGGLGHARNTGARHADPRTAYLTFMDSDDVLPPRAYEGLVSLLEESGSDFATGNVYRLTAEGRSQAWQHKTMTRTVLGTHISRDLTLLADRVAWNKVFRRTFWDRHRLAFPEGVLYEDTPLTIPAHFLAEAVDVLHEHVYYWRIREGSITRRRTDVKGVRDRLAAVDGVSRFLADPDRTRWTRHKRDYDRSVLLDDLQYFIDALPMAGEEYHRVFMTGARDFLSRIDPTLYAELPVEQRMKWTLIREDRLDDLLRLLEYQQRNNSGFHVAGPPLRKRAVLSVGGGRPIPLPPEVTRLTTKDLPVRARLREAVWRDGKLVLRGYAYIRNIAAPGRLSCLKAAVLMSGKRRIVLPVRSVPAPEATHNSRQEQHCYDWSGFEITVDPKRLAKGGTFKPGQWKVGIVVAGAGVVRPAALRALDAGSGASPLPHEVADGMRVVPWYKDGRLHLSVERTVRRLAGQRTVGDGAAELTVRDASANAPVALRLTHRGTDERLERPLTEADITAEGTGHRLTLRIDPAELARGEAATGAGQEAAATWDPVLVYADGRTARIAADPTAPVGRGVDSGGRELVVTATAAGNLVLHLRAPEPFADRLAWRPDGSLEVAGRLPGAAGGGAPLAAVLRHSRYAAEAVFPATRDGERFTAVLRPAAVPTCGGQRPLREGRWYLFLRTAGTADAVGPGAEYDADAAYDAAAGAIAAAVGPALGSNRHGAGDLPVRLCPTLFAGLPAACPSAPRPLTVDRRFHDRLFVEAGPAVPDTDRGPYRQRLLREEHYPRRRSRPLRETVLFSSFDGRCGGDSPRALHRELARRDPGAEHLWVVRDAHTHVPKGARPVLLGSTEWHEALARSRRIVTNTHLPEWFVRRPGQRVLQTWHGTPVKRIGTDLAGTLCADLVHLWPQPRRGHQWSVLLSPNAHSTSLLGRALGYEGEIHETGLPRTDVLVAGGVSGDRDEPARRVRERLGIPADKKVVLYAPTQRDDKAYDADHYQLHLPLDVAHARAALGDDHVLLLRSHPLVADRVPGGADGFVRDVTDFPDAMELLLAADVLVTDYSSLAVDFANTGRPMLFLTPDLEHFRDTVRGFTFDFEAEAPGPLLSDTGELVDALRDLDGVARRSADAYARFRAAYCARDDGRATARAADLLD
ncbi:bifunctional glycosyltransferase/CDP-glycerol:glycerophosphate glycerophosphotransferase [Streptomyces ochraceiscleroticus]|uniref:CDP-glycerol glycerophosphotransferase family protein n=1 Tax=Streptomyces ochraceiscleroticus TaxID=47761 RepID=A0ABW1MCY2_9ACTN|nr:bifunctional glycosyltransferase/CDP-glycerol:glycerophosphate glycerophosphotransferase [Streptomyces ochraceiscleroticus]